VPGRQFAATDLAAFVRSDEAQGLVEYALILAVIAVAVILAMSFLRDQLANLFSSIGNQLRTPGAVPTPTPNPCAVPGPPPPGCG
jgi:pilus assembly protein Flp/PilA